jgi:hypothetical protein
MLTFIKIIGKIISYYGNGVFWYFKVVLYIRSMCIKCIKYTWSAYKYDKVHKNKNFM